MGMDYDELFPGRFLKSGLFKGKDVTLTISGVRLEELPEEKGGVRMRGILRFKETKLELVLNRTNGECLKAMFGRDTGAWLNKRVTWFPATISAFGEETTAIRVRGSPDIAKDMPIEIRLPRKSKPLQATMRVTGRKPSGKAAPVAPANEPEPAPDHDPLTGEVSEEAPFPPADDFAGAAQ